MSKEHVLEVAYTMAQRDGFLTLSRQNIARESGVATGSVSHYWGTMQTLRDAVMTRAIEENDVEIIVAGIAAGNEVVKSAPKELRLKALASMM